MSKLYFTSDLHLGHKNIYKHRPRFSSMEEHDEFMFKQLESLTKHDKLYILGDFLFDCDNLELYLERLSRLPYRITLILGNHDSKRLYAILPPNIELQVALVNCRSFWLSHCPIHPQEMRGRTGNIHGHLHNEVIDDSYYFNVNIDVNNYQFVEFSTIKSYFSKEPSWIFQSCINKLRQELFKLTKYLRMMLP